jgi:DNA-binding transcriptional MerR regulator
MKLRSRYYTVDSAAKKLGLTKWMLLRLEKMGHIPVPRRDPISHYRVYDDEDVLRIRQTIDNLNALDTRIPA